MAATSGTGSTVPWGYCGADATTSAVSGPTASAMASRSVVHSSVTGTVLVRRPNMWAPLWNAAWALVGSTSSGSVTPRSARALSRAARTAQRMLSVPPLVRKPAAREPFSRSDVQPQISDWMEPRDGKARVFRAFSWR